MKPGSKCITEKRFYDSGKYLGVLSKDSTWKECLSKSKTNTEVSECATIDDTCACFNGDCAEAVAVKYVGWVFVTWEIILLVLGSLIAAGLVYFLYYTYRRRLKRKEKSDKLAAKKEKKKMMVEAQKAQTEFETREQYPAQPIVVHVNDSGYGGNYPEYDYDQAYMPDYQADMPDYQAGGAGYGETYQESDIHYTHGGGDMENYQGIGYDAHPQEYDALGQNHEPRKSLYDAEYVDDGMYDAAHDPYTDGNGGYNTNENNEYENDFNNDFNNDPYNGGHNGFQQ